MLAMSDSDAHNHVLGRFDMNSKMYWFGKSKDSVGERVVPVGNNACK